jgi:catechol 2,3-dioxygenase-like lactoylglutathione lyase family enzyme
MKLHAPDYVILIVRDLDRALDFYVGVLGLPLGHRSGDYAQLATGATRLALYSRSAMAKTLGCSLEAPAVNAPGFEIGFKVADVDAAFAELVERGAPPVAAPTDRFWGQRTAYVRDPDGHLIELAQDLRRPDGAG